MDDLTGHGRSRVCILVSDIEGCVEKISYCLVCVSSYLEVEFVLLVVVVVVVVVSIVIIINCAMRKEGRSGIALGSHCEC